MFGRQRQEAVAGLMFNQLLGRAANATARTIAQFLYRLKRYDGLRQLPKFAGDTYMKEKTVVIDECSLLTMHDLVAVLMALDLGHVQRIILVGDPNQQRLSVSGDPSPILSAT